MNNEISSATQSDVVLKTKITVARNLKEFPFPCMMSDKMSERVAEIIISALGTGLADIGIELTDVNIDDLSMQQRLSLAEKALVSPEFIAGDQKNRHLLLGLNGKISIMVNENDHIKIQTFADGMNLQAAYKLAEAVDDVLSKNLNIAFDERLGYLTQFTTDLGTGMRASLIVHLPALRFANGVERISSNLIKLGISVKPLFGEDNDENGALYTVSNVVTLGISEKTAIENLGKIAMQIIAQERSFSSSMIKNIQTVDIVYRSLGILRNARLISTEEAVKLLSSLRMGIVNGIPVNENISADTVTELMESVRPATLMTNAKRVLSDSERAALRAEMLREALK